MLLIAGVEAMGVVDTVAIQIDPVASGVVEQDIAAADSKVAMEGGSCLVKDEPVVVAD